MAPGAAAAGIETSVSAGPASAAGRTAPVVIFSSDRRLRADASDNGTVQISDSTSGQLLGQPLSAGGTDPIASLVFSPDSKLLARVDKDGTVGLWNLAGRAFFMMPEEIALSSLTTSAMTAGTIITLFGSLCAAGIAHLRAELGSDKGNMARAHGLMPQGVLLRKLPSRSQGSEPKRGRVQ
jgi:WD40 repeat protein